MSFHSPRIAGNYPNMKGHRPGGDGAPHRRGNPFPIEFSGKAKLADQRRRYAGYTNSEMRSMLVRLGYKHPEELITRIDLMRALDEVTVAAN